MIKTIANNIIVFSTYLFFLLVGGIVLAVTTKFDLHVFINQHLFKVGNYIFPVITYLGDGWLVYPLLFLLLLVSYRSFLFVGLSVLTASLCTQILKRTIFTNVDRPKLYFWGKYELDFVLGIGDTHQHYSFPSGHATVAFAFFMALGLLVKNNYLKLGAVLLACLVAFSRVYLSQHFFEDIYAGSIIGTLFVLFFYWLFFEKLVQKAVGLDKSLRNSFG